MGLKKGVIHHFLIYIVIAASIGGLILLLIFASGGSVKNPFGKQPNVELKSEYKNPFDKDTQYENPFEEYKNPLLTLK